MYQLSPTARDTVVAAVDALQRLQMSWLAGHLYPVTHPEWPATEADAIVRIQTVRRLLRVKPLVARAVSTYLDAAEAQLTADLVKEKTA